MVQTVTLKTDCDILVSWHVQRTAQMACFLISNTQIRICTQRVVACKTKADGYQLQQHLWKIPVNRLYRVLLIKLKVFHAAFLNTSWCVIISVPDKLNRAFVPLILLSNKLANPFVNFKLWWIAFFKKFMQTFVDVGGRKRTFFE